MSRIAAVAFLFGLLASLVLPFERHEDGAEHIEGRQEDDAESDPEQRLLFTPSVTEDLVLTPEAG